MLRVKTVCVIFLWQTYFGIDVDNIEDPVRRNAIKTMIKTYGQTPKQLFKSAHPSRTIESEKPGKNAVSNEVGSLTP